MTNATPQRDVLLLSHANPDENEEVIRQSAAKVLFVLSRNSNNRDGALRELHLAQGLAKREAIAVIK